ncbi:hypothetical protein [Ferruginibacter sp. SUN106]|uniref:hypothetical protein n=1 Tax=Ferruginibacter sp. SUN106 TaxID=2978348 RepID=UPI003D36522F
MKHLFTLITALTVYTLSVAQSRTATVEYQKINRQAVVNEIPFPEKTIRDAINNKMEQMGYKGKDSKGFTVYKGVRMPELGNDSYDLYFMADRKSRKEKENSTLTLMVSKGFDSFISDSSDSRVLSNAKNYLDTIKNMIAAYDLEQQIIAQEDAVKKADKKYSNLIDDAASLEKKRKSIEKDIEDNKKDQSNQQAEIEKQKQILETLRGKRKQ